MTEVPATLLTGYLGAGKTTLLNRILNERHGRKYAVIVNDFGEINIDAEIIGIADGNMVEMANGCLCCTGGADLVPTLVNGLPYGDGLDGILIEASGLANPAPVAQAFFFAEVREKAKLDAIIAVADAVNVVATLKDSEEAEAQLACADIVLLNKIDLVDDAQREAAIAAIRGMTPQARIIQSERCDVALADILECHAFDITRMEDADLFPVHDHGHHGQADHDHHHDTSITSVSLSADRPVDADKFMPWMQSLMLSPEQDILRAKGILWFHDDDHRFIFQGVGMLLEGDAQRAWHDGEIHGCKLVIIGRNLEFEALKQAFDACLTDPI